jgi:hypothetical protein
MIYLNAVSFSGAKNSKINLRSVSQPIPPQEGDSINFGKKNPQKIFAPISLADKFLAKILGQTLTEKTVIDQFGKKSIEKSKNGVLYEKVLFKITMGVEYPHLLLKYKNGKVVQAKEFQEDGALNFDRKYNSLGKKIKEIFYGPKGKKPAIFGF